MSGQVSAVRSKLRPSDILSKVSSVTACPMAGILAPVVYPAQAPDGEDLVLVSAEPTGEPINEALASIRLQAAVAKGCTYRQAPANQEHKGTGVAPKQPINEACLWRFHAANVALYDHVFVTRAGSGQHKPVADGFG